MSGKRYRLYPKAVEDLESLYLYSVHEFGIQKTEEYVLALQGGFQYLAEEPLIARRCEYIRENLRAFTIGSHIVFFKTTAYGIAVIRVLHQSMDFNRHF